MERDLFVCNSIYQVLVALWLKHNYCIDRTSDILISDHMNNGEAICERLRKYSMFEKVYFVNSFAFSRHKIIQKRIKNIKQNLLPYLYLKEMVVLEQKYSRVFVGNLDAFSALLYDVLIRRNKGMKLFLFEDGLYTYSKLMQDDYESTIHYKKDFIRELLYKYVYKKNYIYGNLSGVFLFHPEDMAWSADFELLKMKKIDCDDEQFLKMCNKIFDYHDNIDKYDRKYIFMEESFAAEGMPINDLELLDILAKRVGKDNIMVKIHPRNPVNRFSEEGYLTNKNTSIPWEIIAMNLKDISDKIFITVASSSVMNPILVLGKNVKAYSLYNLVDKNVRQSKLLSGEFWEIVYSTFSKYNDMITICNSIDEIE